ncbi:MAG: hypothetical protein R3C45_12280 [Phycisphaerales bacterium]
MTETYTNEQASHAPFLPAWIVDHNPFFLISGVLMLAGCFMINHSAHDDPDVVWPIVGLVVVFNVYEFLVIALAIYLGKQRTFCRDAGFLLFLETLLLCDVAHSYNELILKSLPIGLVVSVLALGLAGVKVAMISRGLGVRITKAGVCMLTTLIGLLFLMPIVFRELTQAEWVHEGHFYAAWWVLAALPLAAWYTQPWFGRRSSRHPGLARLRRWTIRLLIVVPLASLLLHLRTAHYVDDRVIHAYNFAPLVLGLAMFLMMRYSRKLNVQTVTAASLFAGMVAIGLSVSFPDTLVTPLLPKGQLLFSPLRVVMLVTAVLFAYVWWYRGAWMCLPPAAGLVLASGLGHRLSTINTRARELLRSLWNAMTQIVPDTGLGWGVLAVAASFVFLLIGAVTSLAVRPFTIGKTGR